MTIEIHTPELALFIRERMSSGRFETVEDVLVEALRLNGTTGDPGVGITGADLVAAMQASPYQEIELHSRGAQMPVRDMQF